MKTLEEIVGAHPYPGRGLVVGTTSTGEAYWAYWLTGRSSESKARRATIAETRIVIEASIPTTGRDPLRHYNALRRWKRGLVIGNGEQVDFVADGLDAGQSFIALLHNLQPEPDPPIMTPRIVAVTDIVGAGWGHVVLGAARMRDGDPARAEWVIEECEHMDPGQALVLYTYASDAVDVRTDAVVRRAEFSGTSEKIGAVLWAALDQRFRVLLIDGDPGLERVVVHEEPRP
jgi:IMP cyclohydrolase